MYTLQILIYGFKNKETNDTPIPISEFVYELKDSPLFPLPVVDVVVAVVVVIVVVSLAFGVVSGADVTRELAHHVTNAFHRTTVERQQLEDARFYLREEEGRWKWKRSRGRTRSGRRTGRDKITIKCQRRVIL